MVMLPMILGDPYPVTTLIEPHQFRHFVLPYASSYWRSRRLQIWCAG